MVILLIYIYIDKQFALKKFKWYRNPVRCGAFHKLNGIRRKAICFRTHNSICAFILKYIWNSHYYIKKSLIGLVWWYICSLIKMGSISYLMWEYCDVVVFPSILHLCSQLEVVQIHQKTPLVTWEIKSGWPGSFSLMRRTISEWQISFPGALWVLFQRLMSAPANKIILSLQFVRSVSARPAGLHDFWRSNTYKTVVTDL